MKKLIISLALISNAHAFRPIPDTEATSSLIEGREVTSLLEISRSGLNSASTRLDLWSGSYWPHYQGSLGIRYRDPSFIRLIDGKEQFGKFKELAEKRPLYLYHGSQLNNLSPSEKYDLVVGDGEMTLTKYSWDLGSKASLVGNVPLWRGICDGWSAASQMIPRPTKTVVMQTPAGDSIKFFPEDIKALGSLLYARAQDDVIFLGKRCRSRALGLFTNACDETNPGTFHRALVNRVGRMGKTFIADVSPGSEVWNYPVQSYDISYFNVFDDEEVSKNFQVVMERFVKKGRFAKSGKRHKNTSYIVGVKAIVRYTDMRAANLLTEDSSKNDKILEKEYFYDLELDHNYNVLGGESQSRNLPDFVWAPNDKTYPLSDPEQTSSPRNQEELAKMAKQASKKGQPLSVIVEKLFEAAK